jgi:hypothetical protein
MVMGREVPVLPLLFCGFFSSFFLSSTDRTFEQAQFVDLNSERGE